VAKSNRTLSVPSAMAIRQGCLSVCRYQRGVLVRVTEQQSVDNTARGDGNAEGRQR
jgi:hypothetical protein